MVDRSVLLLLIEDHIIVRAGMVAMLRGIGFTNIIEAGTIAEARVVMGNGSQADLALVDLDLPDSSGMATIDILQQIDSALPIMLITAETEPNAMISAFERGVLGFVPKTASPKVMLAAIELVLSGGKYIPQEMLGILVTAPTKQLSDLGVDDFKSRFMGLTPRQKEICEHLLMGRSNKEIARTMGISPGTVKIHVSAILRVLNVETRGKALSLLTKKY